MRVQTFQIKIGAEMEAARDINSWFSKNPGIDVMLTYTTQGKTDPTGVECSWLWVLYRKMEEVKYG